MAEVRETKSPKSNKQEIKCELQQTSTESAIRRGCQVGVKGGELLMERRRRNGGREC